MPDLAQSPVRLARQAVHKTIAEASEAAGVNWQTWFLVEQGCYEEIPERIHDFLGRLNLVTQEYYEYRFSKQKEFGELHQLDEMQLPPCNRFISPMQSFREQLNLSRSEFVKSLAVQAAHMYNCEKGKAKFLPTSLREALLRAGLPVEKINNLDEQQEEFYEYFNGQ